MKTLAFTLIATAVLVTGAFAATHRHTSPNHQAYPIESYLPSQRIYPDDWKERHWDPTCNAYMTDREVRRNDEKSGSHC
jgi:hypothetical protein